MTKTIDEIVSEALRITANDLNEGLAERSKTYGDDNSISIDEIIKFIQNESITFSSTALANTLKSLAKEGYLNNPEK